MQRASAYIANLVAEVAPHDSIVGSLAMSTTGVFIPRTVSGRAKQFVATLRSRTADQDLEVEPGIWVEIRAAVGLVEIAGDEPDSHEIIREAARRAEHDMKNFPEEWGNPVLVFTD